MKLIPSKTFLQNENNWLENYMHEYTRKNKSLVVFSHNDLNPGNIIVNDDEIKFIDFDYVGYGHQALDISNHFVEMSGFGSDYTGRVKFI
jgi:thiamine kinase-like enzyme